MKIAVVSPSSSMKVMHQEMRDIGITKLAELGFEVVFGANVDKSTYHTAGEVGDRISDINQFLADETVDILMSAFGGYNSNQLLKSLDYHRISKSRKKFIGYSDITALLIAISIHSGNETFHGPSFASFCDPDLSEYTISGFMHSIHGKRYEYKSPANIAYDKWWTKENYGPREWKKFDGWKIFRAGDAKGLVIGGNLETISSLAGTPYFPDVKKKILFLEDATGTSPGAFHRNMTQLSHMGVFNSISGLILGKAPDYTALSESERLFYILEDVLGKHINYPVLVDANCSHVDPMMTFPLDSQIILKCTGNPRIVVNCEYGED
jgi:muramoyltetrapeptide carboxypeptidase